MTESGENSWNWANGLDPKAPDLRLAENQNLTDGKLFSGSIENGVRFTGMPAFSNGGEHGGTLDSWRLIHFYRHLYSSTASGSAFEMGALIIQRPGRNRGRKENRGKMDFGMGQHAAEKRNPTSSYGQKDEEKLAGPNV